MNTLPSGTVTFLFTDIEGSTALAQQHPDAMPILLARHQTLVSEAVERYEGHVFQVIGDAICAAFRTAPDALNAAVEAQRALQRETWAPAAIRVRMGIHTGIAQAGSEDVITGGYSGYSTLARVQRVMSTAHAEQILLSNTTAELLRGELPAGIAMRDLGEHRLKGILNPERLWQVIAPDLPQDFAPLQTLNAIPNNLPIQLTSFVGREKEIVELKHQLTTTRLLTLTGSGGTGKTRLSLQVAAEVLDTFKDGVWFVELAPVADPALVTQTIAFALGVPEQPGRAILDLLIDHVHAKQLLLILDNCEHLIDACAQLVDKLLRAAPDLKIVTSSREDLGIAGETVHRVPSLSVFEPGQAPTLDAILHSECVRLFLERASAVQSSFQLTEKNAPSIAQICRRLDGIPLAVELAAARVKVFSPEQIASRLDNRFGLLTGGSRTALPRQQTLRALIDWSYDLLSEPERILLRRLAVFSSGWIFEAAEAVCAGEGIEQANVLDLLSHLVDKSLVVVEESDAESARYRLLETIRQYARDKLLESGESVRVRDLHLAFYLGFAEHNEPDLFIPNEFEWLDRREPEQDNLRAALEWALDHDADLALRLAAALSLFWIRRGFGTEGKHWLEAAVKRVESLAPLEGQAALSRRVAQGKVLTGLVEILNMQGDLPGASEYAIAATELWRALGDRRWLARSLMSQGTCRMLIGDPERALASARESVAIYRGLGERWGLAIMLAPAAMVELNCAHDSAQARAWAEESIHLFQGFGSREAAALPLWTLGEIEYAQGNYEKARQSFQSSLDLYRGGFPRSMLNMTRSSLANVNWRLGRYDAALSLYAAVIAEWQQMGHPSGIARCLECVAFVHIDMAKDQSEQAREALLKRGTRLLGAAEILREKLDAHMLPSEQVEYDQAMMSLRAGLDEAGLSAAWAEGRALTMEEAIADAFKRT